MKTITNEQLNTLRQNTGENAWDFHLCLKSLEIILNEVDLTDTDIDRVPDEDLRQALEAIVYTVKRCGKPTLGLLKEMEARNKEAASLYRDMESRT